METPIDRVILEEDAKVFRVSAVLALLDSPVYDLRKVPIEFPPVVPVFNEEHKKVGFASIWTDKERVMADISFDYASEERLLIETQSIPIYARPFGDLKIAGIPFIDFQAKLSILKLSVSGIQLVRVAPADARIQALGKPIL